MPMRPIRSLIPYTPVLGRPPVRWPDGKRLALWVALNVEHYEYEPAAECGRVTWDRVPIAPDVREYSFRDFGNRVGLWRVLDTMDAAGVVPTLSLNLAVLDLFPRIAEEIVQRDLCVMSHGIFNTRYLFGMSVDEERAFYRDNIETLARHTGHRLRGMLTPAVSNTPQTPQLLAEAGLVYHADWVHDDQPVPLLVPHRRLISLPYSYDINDAPLWDGRPYSGDYLVRSAVDQFDRLLADAERLDTGFVMCLALHPYQIGQAHHIHRLQHILAHVVRDPRVWLTSADDIASHYLTHCYDEQLAHALALRARSDARHLDRSVNDAR